MTGQERVGLEVVKVVWFIVGHTGAIVLGLLLIILAIGLGVGLVTLPAALPVGIAGLLLLLWAVMGQATPAEPAASTPPQAAPRMKPDAGH